MDTPYINLWPLHGPTHPPIVSVEKKKKKKEVEHDAGMPAHIQVVHRAHSKCFESC